MKREAFGGYRIEQRAKGMIIKYYSTLKDYLDMIISLSIGLGAAIITFILFSRLVKDPMWPFIILSIAFLLIAILKLTDSVVRIFSLRRDKLIIDKINNSLRIQSSPIKLKIIDLSDIKMIQLKGHIEQPKLSSRIKLIYCNIDVVLKNDKTLTILFINTKKIIKPSDKEIEVEVYTLGNKVANRIANEIGTNYQWLGFSSN